MTTVYKPKNKQAKLSIRKNGLREKEAFPNYHFLQCKIERLALEISLNYKDKDPNGEVEVYVSK